MIPGMAAGWLQEQMGYNHFFIWIMICCVITFGVTALLKIDPEFGKKKGWSDLYFSLSSERQADYGSLEGIREGVADMYTLARTQKIYGSFQSSFSNIAAQLGRVPLEILKL